MIKNVAAAFQFLTILPIPLKTSAKNLERSMASVSLVGAVIGLATGFGYRSLSLVFPATIAAALTLALYIVLTRGLHLDGYMDTIDGFFSGRDRARILLIMKEPTVGSFAVLGIGIWFMVIWAAIPLLTPADFILLHTFTRFGVLLPARCFSYPRESGTGQFFVKHVNTYSISNAFVVVMMVAAGLYWLDHGSRELFLVYGICFALTLVCALAIGWWAQRKIGGVTGDLLGFTIEFTHLLMILSLILAHRFY